MKTILLPIFSGLRARNFFLTDFYPALIKNGLRLVILIAPYKLDYYKKTYGHPNVVFESWNEYQEHWFGRSLQWFAFNALGSGTVREKQYALYMNDHNLPKYLLRRLIGFLFGKRRLVRKCIRLVDRLVPVDPYLVSMIKKYSPDAVLAPDIILGPDRVILRAARKLGIKTIGMVRSWDNLTAKGVIQIMPDYLIAQTHLMKEEAVKLGDMKPERIFVCGVPQFDMYFKPPTQTREEFLNSLSIPLNKRILLCTPFHGEFSQKSALMLIAELAKAVDDGRLPKDLHILVRYRPEDGKGAQGPEEFNSPHITATRPFNVLFTNQRGNPDYEFTQENMDLMVNTLRYSDVTLNAISTLTIDAIALDKPVINIRFDIDPNTPQGSRIELYSHFDHYLTIEQTGGVRLAYSLDELLAQINMYLENPSLDSEGRVQVRREQIEFLDGNSGNRSAEKIAELVNP